ncbi:hypothetical protein RSOL_545490 [Rhizoctonia solani AG-3 Rhs1AP]|uniref:Uncharacterized protein n=1 Tax=Rhizoctonia solani AG-3 Rhs1AP TaxID=1086054 RepID=X8JX13_9AGAM|nr:hypothetical protein RSOL_545490 [Rhizoctonia solani AG-3 Rhs1AP]
MLSVNSLAAMLAAMGRTGAGHVSNLSRIVRSSALAAPETSVPLGMWFLLTLLWTFSCMASLSTSPQYFIRQELPISVPDFDIPQNAGYYSIRTISSWMYSKARPLILTVLDLWVVRLILFTFQCLDWIIRSEFGPCLKIFLWIKYLLIIIRSSTPDYLFNDFILLGIVAYGSHRITGAVDSRIDSEDDMNLVIIHILIEDWVKCIEPKWIRLRCLFDMEYEDLVFCGRKYMFHRGRDALVSWLYRNIILVPSDTEVQAFIRTRLQSPIKPGHSIYEPPRLQTIYITEDRLEQTQTPEQAEEEQEAELKWKRRTRRGGKKYHERKLRKLEKMTTIGGPQHGDGETVVLSLSGF